MQRHAVVYQIVNGPDEGRWRIRLEISPEPLGWAGGQVLWGFDQDTEEAAYVIADRWVQDGVDPRNTGILTFPMR
jgi:hypothetical protein